MNTDRSTIFYRYWTALSDDTITDTLNGEYVPAAAVRLALRLAIDEGSALPQSSTADRIAEWQQNQISRLNDWLQVHEPGLYISPGDTADATLAAIGHRDQRIAGLLADLEQLQTDADADAECAELQEDLTSARNELALLIAERDDLRQQLVVMDADNADLTARLNERHTNGAEPLANPTSAAQWSRNHPAWAALPAADLDVIDQLSSGQIKFRSLSKTLRRDLVHRVIRSLAADRGDTLSSSAWDRYRPIWMPTQGAVAILSPTGRWPSLLAAALNHSQTQPVEAN